MDRLCLFLKNRETLLDNEKDKDKDKEIKGDKKIKSKKGVAENFLAGITTAKKGLTKRLKKIRAGKIATAFGAGSPESSDVAHQDENNEIIDKENVNEQQKGQKCMKMLM